MNLLAFRFTIIFLLMQWELCYNPAMKRIFLDNAATSFPKAPGIADAMKAFLEEDCTNLNRTNSGNEFSLFGKIYSLRSMLAGMAELDTPESVILSSGVTASLNMLIKGLFTQSTHVLVSSCEHNSVMRPLVQCSIPFSRIPCDSQGYILTDRIEELIRPDTKGMVICAAGNVSGAVQDIKTIARIAKKHGLLLIFDAAQAIPFVRFDMADSAISAVVFSGHKGLLGPEGTGGMLLRKDLALSLAPLISGGTGSQSDSEDVPLTLPDRLEAGTQNLPGLLALERSVSFILDNLEKLRDNERKMTVRLYQGLESVNGIRIVGAPLDRPRTSVISVTSDRRDIAEISALLQENHAIETRVGMHCSPSSHKTLGTFPGGTLRFSPGPFTTADEIERTIRAMKEIMNG